MLCGLGILSGIFYFSSSSFAQSKSGVISQTATIFKGVFEDLFGTSINKPVLEIDLKNRIANSAPPEEGSAAYEAAGAAKPKYAVKTASKTGKTAGVASAKSATASVPAPAGEGSGDGSGQNLETPSVSLITETKPGSIVPICDFDSAQQPNHSVLINELAWMGTPSNSNDEWIEIRNNRGEPVKLENWQLINDSGKFRVIFSGKDNLPADSFYLMERADDNTLPEMPANKIYMGAISNSGIALKLFDSQCRLADEVNASGGWSKLGGENSTKKTLERNVRDFDWHTSSAVGGSPGRKNDDRISGSSDQPNSSVSGITNASTTAPTSTQAQENPPPSIPPPAVAQTSVTISEIMAGSDAGSDDEFIELWNNGSQSVDLTGWSIKKKSSSGSESALVSASRLEGKSIPAGKKFLVANEGGYKGSVAPDAKWAKSNTLAYTNNAIVLYDANGNKIEEVAWTEIPKNSSYERQESSFVVQSSPGPQNSSM